MLQSVGFSSRNVEIEKPEHHSFCDQLSSDILAPSACLWRGVKFCGYFLVDPNATNFVAESRGHFVNERYAHTFQEAVSKADQIFDLVIREAPASRIWHSVHRESLINRDIAKLWVYFSKTLGGTCFGNCTTMAYSILESSRILSVSELQKIEATENFAKAAMTAQFLLVSQVGYNQTVRNMQPTEFPKKRELDIEAGLQALDLTVESYHGFDEKKRIAIKCLIAWGVEKVDLVDRRIEDTPSWGLPALIHNTIIPAFKKKNMVWPGLGLINEFYLLSRDTTGEVLKEPIEKFKDSLGSHMSGDFKGIVIINGETKSESTGHAELLEIDNQNGIYILYDNNRGFYQWPDLQSFLSGVEKRMRHEGYDFCELFLKKLIP